MFLQITPLNLAPIKEACFEICFEVSHKDTFERAQPASKCEKRNNALPMKTHQYQVF